MRRVLVTEAQVLAARLLMCLEVRAGRRPSSAAVTLAAAGEVAGVTLRPNGH